jgi:hypothetical protein
VSLLTLALLLTVGADPLSAPPLIVVRSAHVCSAPDDRHGPPVDSTGCASVPINSVDPQGRAIWMVATVTLPGRQLSEREPMGVMLHAIASSAVYWDGTRIGGSGVVSATRELERPGALATLVPLRESELAPGPHTLAIRLSSHRGLLRVGTPMHAVAVGPMEVLRRLSGTRYPSVLLAAGALLLAAVAFAVVMWRDRRAFSWLVVLMLVCALLQLGAEVWRDIVPVSYTQQIWRLLLVLTGAMGFSITMIYYLSRRFTKRHRRLFTGAAVAIAAASPLLRGFDERTFFVLVGSAVLAMAITLPAVWRREAGARPLTLVLLFMVAVAFVDPPLFLDRNLFVGVAALAVLLLVDQLTAVRRLREATRAARARADRLELELLRRRVAPHWMMNTLNAITSWIEEEPRTAVRMVEALAAEFRQLARLHEHTVVPIEEEIVACRRLLELMSLRTGCALALETRGLLPTLAVPPGVLHTLVENALSHGRYRTAAVFTLTQQVEADPPVLEFVAPTPDGALTAPQHDGFGVTYVRSRLREAFGETSLVVHGPSPAGWRTVLTLGAVRA